MDNNWVWLGAGGVILVALLATSKSSEKRDASSGYVSDTDLTNTARMLISETGFLRDPNEMAAIVQVAINRANARGVPLSKVVVPAIVPAWNNSPKYAALFAAAASNQRLPAAKAFVADVLMGKWPNRIGNRRMFVHPSGQPVPPCASSAKAPRLDVSTFAGERCLPPWALVNPVRVGGAQFA